MEPKDSIFTIGLVLTFTVSVIALLVNIKNRRNGMREHLYKEQMSYFLKLSKEIHILLELFYDVFHEQKLTDANDEKVEGIFDRIDEMTETHDFIIPEDISKKLNEFFKSGNDLHLYALNGSIGMEDIKPFQSVCFELSEDFREHLGVDKLSDENRLLSFGKLKLTDAIKK